MRGRPDVLFKSRCRRNIKTSGGHLHLENCLPSRLLARVTASLKAVTPASVPGCPALVAT